MHTTENESAINYEKSEQNKIFEDTKDNTFNKQIYFEKQIDFESSYNMLYDSSEEECLSILQTGENIPDGYKDKFEDSINTKSDSIKQSDKKNTGCGCSKSNCLRLHCSCFKNQGFCSSDCRCQNCLNSKQYEQVRNFVLEKTKIISRASFKEELVVYKNTLFSKRGCRCTQGCNQKYCFCSKNNAKCSSICKCASCKNDKIYIDKSEIKNIYEYLPRKKYKISINFDAQNKNDDQQKTCSVEFKNYIDKDKPLYAKID